MRVLPTPSAVAPPLLALATGARAHRDAVAQQEGRTDGVRINVGAASLAAQPDTAPQGDSAETTEGPKPRTPWRSSRVYLTLTLAAAIAVAIGVGVGLWTRRT
jgi:hypothetical protein